MGQWLLIPIFGILDRMDILKERGDPVFLDISPASSHGLILAESQGCISLVAVHGAVSAQLQSWWVALVGSLNRGGPDSSQHQKLVGIYMVTNPCSPVELPLVTH